ncbi:tagatose 1,6-diphosphate aldolase [Anaerolinea thermophila]|uniref:Tagatose 1,6-diphosphate aldolase n=1 Tax=Anaerolinea thermophila (strain DSM 14523 / JCM 11388 / NBRC 100420 / UNI-1) TaxID=926569 RepID=E8N0N8_ANATU|nr:tagatose 1,6-diphosphate aldolase [Anaerolinea thermophila]BAJ62433.1 putative tagatose 1,6-diphosphate aldolase [Anaerolinea thermophila UNI-1]
MKALSIAKFRSFQTCASAHGTFTFLALDHRQNLRRANPRFEDNHELSRFKLEVTAELAPFATGVLLDPEVSAAQAIASGALPGTKGLVVALEATGYTGEPAARRSQILPGWSVEKAKRMGASMVKLLVYYHPESPTAQEIEAFVAQTAVECQRYDLALMLEPLSYPLKGERLSGEEKRRVVIETARRLTAIPGVDLLKAELPQATDDLDMGKLADACAELHEASQAPWILLSAAASFETYLQQTAVACRAGASGIAVGRAVWQEAVALDGSDRLDFLRRIARPRLERLSALCLALARPFTEVYSAEAPFDWYRQY